MVVTPGVMTALENASPITWRANLALARCFGEQGRFEEAEPLLLESAESLLEAGSTSQELARSTVESVLAFYDSWSEALPGAEVEERRAEWERVEAGLAPGPDAGEDR